MALLVRIVDLLLVIGGFSLIIILHELGHFLAARWAGIRTLAFAVGFGPAIVSYRRGLGLRRGSSAGEYERLLATQAAGATTVEGRRSTPYAGVSTTEYRINALPFGGYVKMLGQDDADPAARSDEPDSFQSTPVWKRMIVISAGVAMNLVIAAALFVVVFMIGLRTEPPNVGEVQPGSPAATAVALNAAALGVTDPGLLPGDTILSLDGRRPSSLIDVVNATVLARGGRTMEVRVERLGLSQPLIFEIEPRAGEQSRMLQLGIAQQSSVELTDGADKDHPGMFRLLAERYGLGAVQPGMRLARVAGREARSLSDVSLAAMRSGGSPIPLAFTGPGGPVEVSVSPRPELQSRLVKLPKPKDTFVAVEHLLGLVAVMQIHDVTKEGAAAGLLPGDVFVQIGDVEWPSAADGIKQIRQRRGSTVRLAVARLASGSWTLHELGQAHVSKDGDGTVGFGFLDTAKSSTRIAGWPESAGSHPTAPVPRGSRIAAVNGMPVTDFAQLRGALRKAVAPASADGATLDLLVELPASVTQPSPRTDHVAWTLSAQDVRDLRSLGWANPLPPDLFKPEQFIDKAAGPIDAIAKGLDRTRSVMLSTYITFARLFQGTIKVEQLKGPVGIAHLGTLIAAKGPVWLMFFLALVSVNLAVINFLPLPIVDGGLFLFLVYEQLRGKPPSPGVQNAAAAVGLVLIVGLLLFVTFHDIMDIIG